MRQARILIVDDEKLVRWSLKESLGREGYEISEAGSGEEALSLLQRGPQDLIFLDNRLPGESGLDILRKVRESGDDTPVVMITAYSDVKTAVEAMRIGASDYLTKPLDLEEIRLQAKKALDSQRLKREVDLIRRQERERYGFEKIIGSSASLRKVLEDARKVAGSEVPTVLILGETGTGKDLLARAIHHSSPRVAHPFVSLNCSAIPETLLESELYGYEKGAFTDARTAKKGLVELAEGGTLYLDEIGEMPLALQVKLLHLIENRSTRRLGGTNDIAVDLRLIASTNRILSKAVAQGAFREDLYYRLNVIPLTLPPLRERREDIVLLAGHFVQRFCEEWGKPIKEIAPQTKALLEAYDWPGNVREMRNVMERAVLLEREDIILPHHLPQEIQLGRREELSGALVASEEATLGEMERRMINDALQKAKGNQSQAARILGISRDTLRYRLKKMGANTGSGPLHLSE